MKDENNRTTQVYRKEHLSSLREPKPVIETKTRIPILTTEQLATMQHHIQRPKGEKPEDGLLKLASLRTNNILETQQDAITVPFSLSPEKKPFASEQSIKEKERKTDDEQKEPKNPMEIMQEHLALSQERYHELSLALVSGLTRREQPSTEEEQPMSFIEFLMYMMVLIFQSVARDEETKQQKI